MVMRQESPQFIEQEPGPRGSPQDPQAPGLELDEEAQSPVPPTAKAEISLSSLVALQEGQAGEAEPWTIASKRWRHSWQTYSKIGMAISWLNHKPVLL
jgi:hypothetical protein